ncbi:MAG TPA: ABC transporter permease [Galbitalea sp.]
MVSPEPVAPTVAPPEPPRANSPLAAEKRPSRIAKLLRDQQFILIVVLVLLVLIFTAINPVFFSISAAGNILVQWAPIVMIAVGELFVIVTGGIDLSVGSTLTLSSVVAAFAMAGLTSSGWADGPTLVVGAIVALATGALVGTINALLINAAKLVPFVATLATLGAGAGTALVLTKGGPIAGGPPSANGLSSTINNGLLSWPVIFVIVILIITGLFLHRSRFGRYTYAIGGNSFAATASGISVKKHLSKVYVLSGIFAGAAGFILYLQLGSGSPSAGTSDELSAIAAVVIGGASLAGGFGKIGGTILGALILETVYSGLTIINIDPNWNQVAVAILIAAAASLQALRGIHLRRKA